MLSQIIIQLFCVAYSNVLFYIYCYIAIKLTLSQSIVSSCFFPKPTLVQEPSSFYIKKGLKNVHYHRPEPIYFGAFKTNKQFLMSFRSKHDVIGPITVFIMAGMIKYTCREFSLVAAVERSFVTIGLPVNFEARQNITSHTASHTYNGRANTFIIRC